MARKHRTMREAQAECRRLRERGDASSLEMANKIEASWMTHPDYESDQACLLRVQAGR